MYCGQLMHGGVIKTHKAMQGLLLSPGCCLVAHLPRQQPSLALFEAVPLPFVEEICLC